MSRAENTEDVQPMLVDLLVSFCCNHRLVSDYINCDNTERTLKVMGRLKRTNFIGFSVNCVETAEPIVLVFEIQAMLRQKYVILEVV